MKKILSLSLIIAFIGFGISCKKKEEAINKLTEFDINYSTTLTIPSNSIAVNSQTTSVEFTTPNVPTQQSSKFSAEGTAQNLIDEIKMTQFKIATTSTVSTANLDYLKSVIVYIKASGQSDQIIASKTNIPQGTTSVSLDLEDVNIKNYIFQDNIQFKVKATFDVTSSTPTQSLKLDETVHVKATLLK
jgi:hypothetical protein